jgi:hypothetical protein
MGNEYKPRERNSQKIIFLLVCVGLFAPNCAANLLTKIKPTGLAGFSLKSGFG